jgi:hypothetical protein
MCLRNVVNKCWETIWNILYIQAFVSKVIVTVSLALNLIVLQWLFIYEVWT